MNKPLKLPVDRSDKLSLSEQIRRGIAKAIEDGVLEPGARLPSWQDLAVQLASLAERYGPPTRSLPPPS